VRGGGVQYTLMTPLHWAAADGNTEMVQLLLRKGANIEAKSAVRTRATGFEETLGGRGGGHEV
jgi:ankyrin repeat protein